MIGPGLIVLGLFVGMAQAQPGSPAPGPASGAITPPRCASAPGSFLVDDDYPAEALKARAEGISFVTLHIDAKGKPTGCDVAQSSGSSSLDQATCRMVSRLKYLPARDAAGRPIAGELTTKMHWTLPGRYRAK